MPRIFIAIPLPPDIAADLDRILPQLPGLKRVAPELMHVTLAFVGQVGEDRLPSIIDAVTVAASEHGPFDVELDAVGRFPEHGRPRGVWIGMGKRTSDAIVRVGASVRAELLRHRVQFDPKPLRAHVTLGRVRDDVSEDDARAIASAVATVRPERARTYPAVSVHVIESKLSPRGPLYSSRGEVPLSGPPGAVAGR